MATTRFRKLTENDLDQVLKWRRKTRITRNMLTNISKNPGDQKEWFRKISKDPTCLYWVIELENTPIGLVNLAQIDHSTQECTIGFYIGADEYAPMSGAFLPYIYNHVFMEMGIKRIFGAVLAHNTGMLKIHELHGYRVLRTLKNHFEKNGESFDVIEVELTAKNWLEQKRFSKWRVKMTD
ncbi:UDP-4-amino-4,6-dideoxy-N-acetyl-beta-L-altrosamine N-acetyltransferase [Gammaproteobacteria bacterium]|jgi:UDP-4-amino-4,6-dideoxy-N-acetyl-beta-L-altrosamine N-acetyltransferase|nr:UDP-4-amino-4,6-dideoxy-N-acetyl-beta-L-altrosamine N-acetyltransferase [Gammaproteobacteria bacterium]